MKNLSALSLTVVWRQGRSSFPNFTYYLLLYQTYFTYYYIIIYIGWIVYLQANERMKALTSFYKYRFFAVFICSFPHFTPLSF